MFDSIYWRYLSTKLVADRQYSITNENILILIKLRLHDQFIQGWYSQIEHSPKAWNYRIFKENFEFDNYYRILEDKDMYTLSRTTNHKLPIETI